MKSNLKFNIYELCKALSLQQLKSLGFFNHNDEELSNKYIEYLGGIIKGEIIDDTSAKSYLGYKNQSTFQRFKHRFTERVKTYMFIIDLHKHERKKEDEVNKYLWSELALAKILLKANSPTNARAIFEKVYIKAKKYEFIDIMAIALPTLRQYFGFIAPNEKLYNYYKEEYKIVKKEYDNLQLASVYYDEVSHYYVFSRTIDDDAFGDLCLKYYKELTELFSDANSTEFRIKCLQIASFGYLLKKDFTSALEINNSALNYIEKKENSSTFLRYKVLKDILSTKLKMGGFVSALKSISEIENLFVTHNYNYFSIQALKYQVNAFLGNYTSMYEITYAIKKIKPLKNYPIQIEQWKIKEAFVQYLVSADKIDNEILEQKPLRKFRLSRFVNDIELYSKDKRGANIAIHIIELLFFLNDRNFDAVLNRLESLNKYSYRYLRNDSTLRSNCFIKMLLKLPEADFNPIRTKRYVSKYWKKLQENPLDFSLQSAEIEIIPYEQLWAMVIDAISPSK